MSTAVELLNNLRSELANLSRNRNFDLYKDPQTAKAMRLHRRLVGIANLIRTHHEAGQLRLTVSQNGSPTHLRLLIEVPGIAGQATAHISREELQALRQEPDMDEIFVAEGIPEEP